MHKLLADLLAEYPHAPVYLSLGRFPLVESEDGRSLKEVTDGFDAPLNPTTMAEIINSVITDKEGSELKQRRRVTTQLKDDLYLRDISVEWLHKGITVTITSKLLSEIEAENKKLHDSLEAISLIKG